MLQLHEHALGLQGHLAGPPLACVTWAIPDLLELARLELVTALCRLSWALLFCHA